MFARLLLSPSPSLCHTFMLPSLSISAATPACLIIVWQLEVPLHVAAAPLLPSFLCASFDAGYKFQMNLTTTLKTNQRKPRQQQWALNCCMNISRTSKRNWVYCLTHTHTQTYKESQTHLSTPCYGCSCRQRWEGRGVSIKRCKQRCTFITCSEEAKRAKQNRALVRKVCGNQMWKFVSNLISFYFFSGECIKNK